MVHQTRLLLLLMAMVAVMAGAHNLRHLKPTEDDTPTITYTPPGGSAVEVTPDNTTATTTPTTPTAPAEAPAAAGGGGEEEEEEEVDCHIAPSVPNEMMEVPECVKALHMAPSQEKATVDSMTTFITEMCVPACSNYWDQYGQNLANWLKKCGTINPNAGRMIDNTGRGNIEGFFHYMELFSTRGPQDKATRAPKPENKAQLRFPGYGMGCTKDQADNTFCAAKPTATEPARCEFVTSKCCMGAYMKLAPDPPSAEALNTMDQRCPGAKDAASATNSTCASA